VALGFLLVLSLDVRVAMGATYVPSYPVYSYGRSRCGAIHDQEVTGVVDRESFDWVLQYPAFCILLAFVPSTCFSTFSRSLVA
jgi:hypothetical protein